MSRSELMYKIQVLGFILMDVGLYLDTHPKDTAALNYFNKYSILYKLARNDYEQQYGPITPMGTNDTTSWSWIDDPWPWEGGY